MTPILYSLGVLALISNAVLYFKPTTEAQCSRMHLLGPVTQCKSQASPVDEFRTQRELLLHSHCGICHTGGLLLPDLGYIGALPECLRHYELSNDPGPR